MNAFYGNPDSDGNGHPDRAWEDANLIHVTPRWPMVLAWATSTPVKYILFHRKAAPALERALDGVLAFYRTPDEISKRGLHLFGGSYAFRVMRGGSSLSTHSWGCTIDLDPTTNWFGRKYNEHLGMMPLAVVRIFEAQGFEWGGLWRKADAMHFQAAHV